MTSTSKAYDDYVVFVESKSLRGRSKEEYLRQVRKLAEYYPQRSLKSLSERQVFDYLIFRRDQQKLRPSTLNQAVVALRMFYRDFLQRDWPLWSQFEIRRDQPLPLVLTGDETRRLLRAIRSSRNHEPYRVSLTSCHAEQVKSKWNSRSSMPRPVVARHAHARRSLRSQYRLPRGSAV
jgi:site-specific recombinase XerD